MKMIDLDTSNFVIACLFMGLGIGLDVALATFAIAGQLDKRKPLLIWLLGVTLTHTVFPMAGYLITYFGVKLLPAVMPLLGVIAFFLIARFVFVGLAELRAGKNETSEKPQLIHFALVIAVSWDALLSGPAKSAQVIEWPSLYVWSSFLIVGAVVALFALLALLIFRTCQRWASNRWAFIRYVIIWGQFSIINYFGLLALARYSFSSEASGLIILTTSAVMILVMMLVYKQPGLKVAN